MSRQAQLEEWTGKHYPDEADRAISINPPRYRGEERTDFGGLDVGELVEATGGGHER